MGNEQSSSNGSGGVSSSLSFLAGKNNSSTAKKAGQVVVVRPGSDPLPNPNDDEILKRFKEIPRFYPILKGSLNQPGLRDPPDIATKMSYRPILRFAYRIQDHLAQCAQAVSSEQNTLATRIKDNDYIILSMTKKLNERKKRFDKLAGELEKVKELNTMLANVRFVLQDLVPLAETINELFPICDRLPLLDLGRVLDRSPAASSPSPMPSEGSTPSTPVNSVSNALRVAHNVATTSIGSLHIEPVEELAVIDRHPNM